MPIYEYQCAQCGGIIEVMQKFSDKPLTQCKHCSGKLHKLISQSAFHLKGSGWYVTDYAGKGQNKKTASNETKTKQSTSTSDSKTSEPTQKGNSD